MQTRAIILQLPEPLYARLAQAADAVQRPLDAVLLRAVELGGPPGWDDVPAEFQADLATLDHLTDEGLWQIAHNAQPITDWERYQALLDQNAAGTLAPDEALELARLRADADRFMLRKAHAVALLRWRGHLLSAGDTQS